jgi:hypothetical protein
MARRRRPMQVPLRRGYLDLELASWSPGKPPVQDRRARPRRSGTPLRRLRAPLFRARAPIASTGPAGYRRDPRVKSGRRRVGHLRGGPCARIRALHTSCPVPTAPSPPSRTGGYGRFDSRIVATPAGRRARSSSRRSRTRVDRCALRPRSEHHAPRTDRVADIRQLIRRHDVDLREASVGHHLHERAERRAPPRRR